jgi:hypothetical protein
MGQIKHFSFFFYTICLQIIFLPKFVFAQNDTTQQQPLRWEASVQSGLFLDLFYANIVFGGDDSEPLGYSDEKGKRVQSGKMDRLEIKYLLNRKSALSFNFSNALWKDFYGTGNDPLEAWTETKRYKRRMQFTANYYRIFPSGKKAQWSIASGFQIQIEKISFPFYRTDDPNNPGLITYINARPSTSYFEDWAIPLTVAYHWKINKNLHLGLMYHTAYTTGTGIDGMALMGSIAIPFGKTLPTTKIKYKNNQP